MLVELLVTDLGVIDRLALLPGPAMTALTGETGAGKTLIVEAIDLLVGGRADGSMVRAGADEAIVEGRFVLGDGREAEEVILRRVIPREGRSRAYVDGGLASAATLGETGRRLVDLHGQHDHQSLLSPSSQRRALDRYASIDLEPLRSLRSELHDVDERLAALGGDERERAREVDLLRFQSNELAAAGLDDPREDELLEAEEDRLGDALAHREAALAATETLSSDGGAGELVAVAIAAIDGRSPFGEAAVRLRALAAELADVASEVRATGESIEDDQERLAEVRARRKLLHDLGRKYGDTVDEMCKYHAEVDARLDELASRDQLAAALDRERAALVDHIRAAEAEVGAARRAAAPKLAAETQAHLRELAMPKAQLEVWVGDDDPGDDVVFALAANPGSPPLPLAKVASGGELARTMLALRLVLTEAPDTLIFDEVDAGVGGEAATAVGRALASLGARHQVLVVTHLAQVAAFAQDQIQVAKHQARKRTTTSATVLDGDERVVEVARMLSGSPDSDAARTHAAELLAEAARGPATRRRRTKGSP
jgi:DNA repair protein RecN (Recombination protein N)